MTMVTARKAAADLKGTIGEWLDDAIALREMRSQTLILANLRDADFDAFHAAHVGYSGSTGKGSTESYGDIGPYIATCLSELPRALEAMGWECVAIERLDGQFIARREPQAHATWESLIVGRRVRLCNRTATVLEVRGWNTVEVRVDGGDRESWWIGNLEVLAERG